MCEKIINDMLAVRIDSANAEAIGDVYDGEFIDADSMAEKYRALFDVDPTLDEFAAATGDALVPVPFDEWDAWQYEIELSQLTPYERACQRHYSKLEVIQTVRFYDRDPKQFFKTFGFRAIYAGSSLFDWLGLDQ